MQLLQPSRSNPWRHGRHSLTCCGNLWIPSWILCSWQPVMRVKQTIGETSHFFSLPEHLEQTDWERASVEPCDPAAPSDESIELTPDVESGQNHDPSSETIVVLVGPCSSWMCITPPVNRVWLPWTAKIDARLCFFKKLRYTDMYVYLTAQNWLY